MPSMNPVVNRSMAAVVPMVLNMANMVTPFLENNSNSRLIDVVQLDGLFLLIIFKVGFNNDTGCQSSDETG